MITSRPEDRGVYSRFSFLHDIHKSPALADLVKIIEKKTYGDIKEAIIHGGKVRYTRLLGVKDVTALNKLIDEILVEDISDIVSKAPPECKRFLLTALELLDLRNIYATLFTDKKEVKTLVADFTKYSKACGKNKQYGCLLAEYLNGLLSSRLKCSVSGGLVVFASLALNEYARHLVNNEILKLGLNEPSLEEVLYSKTNFMYSIGSVETFYLLLELEALKKNVATNFADVETWYLDEAKRFLINLNPLLVNSSLGDVISMLLVSRIHEIRLLRKIMSEVVMSVYSH